MPGWLSTEIFMNEIPPKVDRTWEVLCHISALAMFVIPFGNIIAPLVIWLIKKAESPSIDEHGKASLNFQITVSLAWIAVAIAAFVLSFILIGFLLIPLLFIIPIAGVVFVVIASIKASQGELYRYPLTYRFIP
jgi:uncharacterized protein